MATFREFIQSIQADGNDGQAFEHFCKWFLLNDPYWKTQVDKAWLWDEWPDRWGPDCGIDLIIKHKNGETWAVQAKCYDEKYSVTKNDMNAFLTESNRAVIQHRLLLASTNGMSSNGERACAGQEKPVTLYMLKDFDAAQVEYPSHISDLASAKIKTKPTPDPYQVRAIDDVVAKFEGNDRGQLIMACGTGKTFTTLWIKEALAAQTTLVLVPSLNLLSQTLNEWAFAAKDNFDVLCVCSEKSVGDRDKEDMALGEAPFSVTSDHTDISNFLSGGGHKVIFCTYQSSDLIAEVQLDKSIEPFDLVIADEAHRCSGKSDAAFSKVLDGEAIRATKRLFTTATPRLYSSSVKKAAADRGVEVYGMDDETVFGPVLHTLTFGQAITEDLLNDYQVVIVGVDQPMIKEWIVNQELVAINPDNQTDARTLAAKIGLLKAIKDYDLSRVISFHSRVKSARDFASEVTELVDLIEPLNRPQGSLWASHVSGTMRTTDRIIEIGKLKSLENADIGLLANAKCLSEGVDVPSLDGIAFIDPRGSQVDIIQAVGRAIRKVRGAVTQKVGTIVLPVFIEDGDNAEAQIEASNFKPVWDVLKALRSHDEVLAEHLDQYRTNMAKRSGTIRQTLDDRIIFDLPMTVGPNFSSALRTVLVEAATDSWEFWFGFLEVFQKREGHCRVPVLHKEEGHKLGNWVHNQRQQKDRLSHDRIKRLDALGFVWDPLEEQWEEGFSNLQKFYNREGHCNIKRSHNEDGYKLGRWVGMQRLYRHSMVNDRKQKLENLGFIWNLPTHQWNIMFSKLNAYYEEYKTSLVPLRFDLGEPDRIGVWCNEQRANYKSGTISGSHIDQLEKFHDWRWNFDDWDKILNSVANFCFEKRCDVNGIPKNERLSSGQYLKNWMNSQRKKKKNGELEIDKIIKLERLPGWYWDEFDIWINNYECALNFAKINKHLRVPRGKLNTWIKGQRRRKEFLTEEQINLLEAIDCWSWDPIQDAWGKGISELRLYQKHKNHVYVPQRYTSKTGFKLGLWVHKCRQEYKSGKLKKTRIRDLETFPYWVWDPLTHLWEEAFIKLQQFHEKEGHCKVPARHMEDDHKLGQWVSSQRSKKDSLSPDRIKRLDDLGFIWDASKTKSASKND